MKSELLGKADRKKNELGNHSWWATLLVSSLVGLAGWAAYSNSFYGPFIFDDTESIPHNLTIRHLWPIKAVFAPPRHGETVSGRPILNLSFAVNYALSGKAVRGYHVTNLIIHLLNGLLLLGILRRTFLLPALRSKFGRAALPLAGIIALLWVVHPLQTESVTYIAQRAESLATMFYLLVLYAVIRGSHGRTTLWFGLAVAACWVGVATKEIVTTAPVMVLLYDRTLLAGTFRRAWQRRWGLYLGLASSWGLLIGLILQRGFVTKALVPGVSAVGSYTVAQPGVILFYLRQVFWPYPLCLSWCWLVPKTWGAIAWPMFAVGLLLAATIWALLSRNSKAWGLLGAWFFLGLAPSSSFMPLIQLACEHRMYLPLASVLTLVVLVGYAASQKWLMHGRLAIGLCLVIPAAVILGRLTFSRNKDYRSELALWEDAAKNAPHNAEAFNNWGVALWEKGREAEAIHCYQQTLAINPDHAGAHNNFGNALMSLGRPTEAIEHFQQALKIRPKHAVAQNNWGNALVSLGRPAEAIPHFQQSLQLKPDYADAQVNWGTALLNMGKPAEACLHFQKAVRLKPDAPADAQYNWGNALVAMGRPAKAIKHFHKAVHFKPDYAIAHNNWGNALLSLGRPAEAIEHFQQAVRLKPDYAQAQFNWGNALFSSNHLPEAIKHYQQAVRLNPDYVKARYSWGNALLRLGRLSEAIEQFERVVQINPNYADVQFYLCVTLAQAGKIRDAIEHGRKAAILMKDNPQVNQQVAWLLATHDNTEGGNSAEAVKWALRACQLTQWKDSVCLDSLAAAYASAGRFQRAVNMEREAWQLAQAAGQDSQARAIQMRLQLYRDRKPYREPAASPTVHTTRASQP